MVLNCVSPQGYCSCARLCVCLCVCVLSILSLQFKCHRALPPVSGPHHSRMLMTTGWVSDKELIERVDGAGRSRVEHGTDRLVCIWSHWHSTLRTNRGMLVWNSSPPIWSWWYWGEVLLWHPIPYIMAPYSGHYFGPWLKVVHYIGNKVLKTHARYAQASL